MGGASVGMDDYKKLFEAAPDGKKQRALHAYYRKFEAKQQQAADELTELTKQGYDYNESFLDLWCQTQGQVW